jgi:hypothetical protein
MKNQNLEQFDCLAEDNQYFFLKLKYYSILKNVYPE